MENKVELEKMEDVVRSADLKENCFEWCNGDTEVFVTLARRKLILNITEMAEKHPDEVKIIKVNKDGTVYAKVPLKCIGLRWPREMSEEQKEKARERFMAYRESKEAEA